MKDVFVFYRSYHEAMKDFSDAQYGKLMRALAEYALNEKEPEKLDKISAMVFTLIKPQIDTNTKKTDGGKKGGRPKNKTIGFENEETIGFENEKAINEKHNDIPSINPSTSINTSINTSMMPPAVSSRLEQFFENAEILRNKPFTLDEKNRITQKLVILGKTDEEQLKVINQAIERGWKDLYPLKKTKAEVDMAEFEAYYAKETI